MSLMVPESRAELDQILESAFADAPWPFGGEREDLTNEECGALFDDYFLLEAAVVRFLLPYWLKLSIDPVTSHLVNTDELVLHLNALESVTPDLRRWLTSFGDPAAAALTRSDIVLARQRKKRLELVTQTEAQGILKWLLYVRTVPMYVDEDTLRMAIGYWSQRVGVSVWDLGISDDVSTDIKQ